MENIFTVQSNENFEKAVQELIDSLYYQQNKKYTDFPSDIIASAKEEVINWLLEHNFDTKSIFESINNKTWDKQRISYFIHLLEENKSELLYGSINYHNRKYGGTLYDFDWLFKLVFGTNELNSLKYPLLQLNLTTVNGNGVRSNLLFDVKKNMLLKLIHCLEEHT